MLEENGHKWHSGFSLDRCRFCQMKYGYYLDIKRSSEEQPEREDLKEWMQCQKNPNK